MRHRTTSIRIDNLIDWGDYEPLDGHYYLYGLYDIVGDGHFVYVGVTINPKATPDPFADWWKAIRKTGDRPRMAVLYDFGNDGYTAYECEKAVLQQLSDAGMALFNRKDYEPLETNETRR